jgi:hypothetical protein
VRSWQLGSLLPTPVRGLSQDGGRASFSLNLRASLFNDDLSNETTFSQIHLAGQYLESDVQVHKIALLATSAGVVESCTLFKQYL